MKKKSFISLFAVLLGLGVTTTSCEDMLTPDMDRYAEGFSGRDTVNFYFGILSNVQDVIENNVILGEVRADMVTPTAFVSDTLSKVANFIPTTDADNGLLNRAAYYKVINQCNFYLDKVDSMAMKNNKYYMRRELAQVQMVRAWTYMQLVQNYGEVPFITKPVDNAGTGWETNSPEGKVTAENLLDKLMETGLDKAYAYEIEFGYPNYGTFKTGAVDIAHLQTIFPGDLVLGDLYLLRGKDKNDYVHAASHYYRFLEKERLNVNRGQAAHYDTYMEGDDEKYRPVASGWASAVVSLARPDGAISIVPSAANSSLGKTLTRVQQIYGFDPKSSNHSSVDGSNDNVVSGNISITANYKNRQMEPSLSYIRTCRAQVVTNPKMGSSGLQVSVEYPNNLGDCRIDGAFKYVQTLDGRLPFVQKFGARSGNNEHGLSDFRFRYGLSVYRVNQIYLRYAEAINRAGYPRHAFAVLRNGLNSENIPELRYDSIIDSTKMIKYVDVPYANYVLDGNQCIDAYELMRAEKESEVLPNIKFLDFDEFPGKNCGIHELGCGKFTDMDTLYTYDLRVLGKGFDRLGDLPGGISKFDLQGRIAQEFERSGIDLAGTPEQVESTPLVAGADWKIVNVKDSIWANRISCLPDSLQGTLMPYDMVAQQNAVETLIAEEMALETAFEGWRYYDLYRIARHKNKVAAGYGTEWFAWLVSRRGLELKPYEQPKQTGELYSVLQAMENWYLKNPEY